MSGSAPAGRCGASPGAGGVAYSSLHGLTSAVREIVTPHRFFETLGVRYAGPIDGHDIAGMELALAHAAEWDGPIVVTLYPEGPRLRPRRGGRHPAPPRLQGPAERAAHLTRASPPRAYTDAFTRAVLRAARTRPEVVAITAAMPGPTGLLPFQAEFPDRFLDVGISEQHAVTAAAGMAMVGLRPWWPCTRPLPPRLRPSQPGRGPPPAAPWSSPSTGPASLATTGPATTASSTCPSACRCRG